MTFATSTKRKHRETGISSSFPKISSFQRKLSSCYSGCIRVATLHPPEATEQRIVPIFPRLASISWLWHPVCAAVGIVFPPQPTDGLIFRFSCVRKAICPDFPPFRHTPPVVFTWPSISPAYAGAGLGRRSSIRLRIFRNSSLGTATSANWNVT